MKTAMLASFALFTLCHVAAAKGITVKIVMQGAGLSQPLEISNERVGSFNIWNGPGAFANGVEETEGFIVDWSRGIVADLPGGVRKFEVEFFERGPRANEPVYRSYRAVYAYDPATHAGFVYLPDGKEPLGQGNMRRYGGGREGHWFRATGQWDSFAELALAGR